MILVEPIERTTLYVLYFALHQFLGEWYVIQRFQSNNRCIKQNISKTDDYAYKITYKLSETRKSTTLSFLGLEQMIEQSSNIHFPYSNISSKMEVNLPLSVWGASNYWVVMTDYTMYAAVWSCRNMFFGQVQSADILSRTPRLDRLIIDKIRRRFEGYGINVNHFSVIDHSECPEAERRRSSFFVLLV
ncbi:apolipoprotein D-like [Centruroides sculpturatus]|uniref:apolipoprotein D-like n=1 Tax=Centruroides sculpturatus TaxID=218467 RepID=UPI000C6C9230|nr:apolipoprotein D-like [Centruroides sculpturatus]XP_023241500.1 apolipoprotein D-like [Centruroides sculpturatus]